MVGSFQTYLWDDDAAYAKLERAVWPQGPVCPQCGNRDRIGHVAGRGGRAGLRACPACRNQFRATIGTVFAGSRMALHRWFQALFLLFCCSSGVTVDVLGRVLEVSPSTAATIARRLEAAHGGSARPAEPQPPRPRLMSPGSSAPREAALAWVPPSDHPQARQFARFEEAARALGPPLDGERFDEVLSAVVKPRSAHE